MVYDNSNIFAKILRGEVPCQVVDEDEYTLSFEDINPQAQVHVLVIPKNPYVDWTAFTKRASKEEIVKFTKAISRVAKKKGISKTGYRVISNIGLDGNQEVPHLHMHIIGGRTLGPLLESKR